MQRFRRRVNPYILIHRQFICLAHPYVLLKSFFPWYRITFSTIWDILRASQEVEGVAAETKRSPLTSNPIRSGLHHFRSQLLTPTSFLILLESLMTEKVPVTTPPFCRFDGVKQTYDRQFCTFSAPIIGHVTNMTSVPILMVRETMPRPMRLKSLISCYRLSVHQ